MGNQYNPDNPYTNGKSPQSSDTNPYIPNNQVPQNPYMPNNQAPQNPYMPNNQVPPNPYGQNGYAPNPYGQNGYAPNPYQQYSGRLQPLSPEDNKKANILCTISLCLCFLPSILLAFLRQAGVSGDNTAFEVLSMISGWSVIASWVLVIIVRVKYKQNTFGKVLMWLYIILAILGLVAFFMLLVACTDMVRHCN